MRRLILFCSLISSFALYGCKENQEVEDNDNDPIITNPIQSKEIVSVSLATSFEEYIYLIGEFPIDAVSLNVMYNDDTSETVFLSESDFNASEYNKFTTPGTHQVTVDYYGFQVTFEIHILAEPVLANGIYDLSYLSNEDFYSVLAQLDLYTLNKMANGVPLYNSVDYIMYQPRVQLANENYGYFGFGEDFSSVEPMNEKDVFRRGIDFQIINYNPWHLEYSDGREVLQQNNGSLYRKIQDESGYGYKIVPDLASSNPVPIKGEEVNGEFYSTKWEISIKDNLIWSFSDSVDTSTFDINYEKLTAEDFIYTYQIALENEWDGAVSQGMDFISIGIKNAEAFVNNECSFDQVGFDVSVEDNSITFIFNEQKSESEIMYLFTNNFYPIQKDLYLEHGEFYGSDVSKIASSGIYYLNDANENIIHFLKNENYPNKDEYHFSDLEYIYYTDEISIFNGFMNDEIDVTVVPYSKRNQVVNDQRLYIYPSSIQYRLTMNTFGTDEFRNDFLNSNDDSTISTTFELEPILMYEEMQKALFYGYERLTENNQLSSFFAPSNSYFSKRLIVDVSGKAYYGMGTIEADIEQVSNTDLIASKQFFQDAVLLALADGYYLEGSEENPTIITLDLIYISTVQTELLVEDIITQYETLFEDDIHHMKIQINKVPYDYINFYNDYVFPAKFDLSLVSLSSIYEIPYEQLHILSTINSSDMIHFGIDLNEPDLLVTYKTEDGDYISEYWSYNAFVESLYSETTIINGNLQ